MKELYKQVSHLARQCIIYMILHLNQYHLLSCVKIYILKSNLITIMNKLQLNEMHVYSQYKLKLRVIFLSTYNIYKREWPHL